jgi:hypothetical protein
MDWWADPARRAGFRQVSGNWTTVSDEGQSHQVGSTFAVSFAVPGQLPQGEPPQFEAAFHFVAPSTDMFSFSVTAVDAHLYPATNAATVCLRLANATLLRERSSCIASGTVDQRGGGVPRDGRWQRALTAVPLAFNQSYEFAITWNPMRGGYAVADAVLIESQTLYHSASGVLADDSVVIGPMDSRIFLKT